MLLEASDAVGGKLARAEVGGVTVDVGAESMLNRRPEAVALAREVGLGDALVHPATISANLWSRGRMRPMPRTLMGVPTDARLLADSGVVSRPGLARVALEPVLPPTHLDGQDVSIGWLVEERFGREVVDRLVEPLLGGVYAGHAREISARAAVPQVVALLDQDRSMMRAAAAATVQAAGVPGVRRDWSAGSAGCPARSVAAAGLDVRTGTTVRDLAHAAEGGWRPRASGSTRDAEVLHADAVVLATPARADRPAARRRGARRGARAVPHRVRVDGDRHAGVPRPATSRRPRDRASWCRRSTRRSVKASTYSFAKWDWVASRGARTTGCW